MGVLDKFLDGPTIEVSVSDITEGAFGIQMGFAMAKCPHCQRTHGFRMSLDQPRQHVVVPCGLGGVWLNINIPTGG